MHRRFSFYALICAVFMLAGLNVSAEPPFRGTVYDVLEGLGITSAGVYTAPTTGTDLTLSGDLSVGDDLTVTGNLEVPDGLNLITGGTTALEIEADQDVVIPRGDLTVGDNVTIWDTGGITLNGHVIDQFKRQVWNLTTDTVLSLASSGGRCLTNSGAGASAVALTLPADPTGYEGEVIRVDSGTLWLTPGSGDNFIYSGGAMAANESLVIDAQYSSVKVIGISASVIAVVVENGTIAEETP